jgi:S1-C subfamily serine protease
MFPLDMDTRPAVLARALCATLSLALAAPALSGCDGFSRRATEQAPATSPEPSELATPPASLPGAPTGSVVSVPAVPPPSPGSRIEDENNTIAVFRDVAPSVVFVTQKRTVVNRWEGTTAEVAAGSGSGFIWDDRGNIVTNFHVIKGAQSLTVTLHSQKTYDATVVGVEPRKDIAVLRIKAPPSELKAIRVAAASDTLEVGQKTVAIGNPFGLDHTLTTGVVSAVGRQVDGIGGVTIRDMIQTDAAINPGNSGGPLLDSSGRLIGMNTMIYSKSGGSSGIGFAVPASSVARVVPQLIRTGKVEQVGIGVSLDPERRLERRLRMNGVIILGVAPGGPAEKAGLRGLTESAAGLSLGDVIVGIDKDKVDNYDGLYNALDKRRAGDKVVVKVRRNEKTVVDVPMELVLLK